MKTLFASVLIMVFSFLGDTAVGDNYRVMDKSSTSQGYEYEIKCTDCGSYITVYYKSSTGKYSRGDSPWYSQYSNLEDAATNGCSDKCD